MRIENVLSNLAGMARQNAEGCRRAMEIFVGQPELAHFFEERADNHEQAADAFERDLERHGERVVPEQLVAAASEGWSEPAPDETNPKAVIAACHRGEERMCQAFEDALRVLPEDRRWTVAEYFENSRSAVAKLHAWLEDKEVTPDER